MSRGQSIPYYDYKQEYRRDATDPRLLEFLEDFGELYNRQHELFHDSNDDFRTALDGALDEAKSKRRARDVTVQSGISISIGSPRVRSRGLGVEGDDVLRLERFKVKTVYLEDDEVGTGGHGGQFGPVVTKTNANSKR